MRGRDCFFYRKIIKLRSRKIAEAAKMSPYFLWRKESIFFSSQLPFKTDKPHRAGYAQEHRRLRIYTSRRAWDN